MTYDLGFHVLIALEIAAALLVAFVGFVFAYVSRAWREALVALVVFSAVLMLYVSFRSGSARDRRRLEPGRGSIARVAQGSQVDPAEGASFVSSTKRLQTGTGPVRDAVLFTSGDRRGFLEGEGATRRRFVVDTREPQP